MTDFMVVLLTGFDGTGTLVRPLLDHLPPNSFYGLKQWGKYA